MMYLNKLSTYLSGAKRRKLLPVLLSIALVFVFLTPLQASSATSSTKVVHVAAGTQYSTNLYVIKTGKPGPVVMIVGGVHGNETAGYKAADIVKDYSITRGTLLVLPQANKLAIQQHRRYTRGGSDLNRDFPRTSSQSADNTLSRSIYKVVRDYDVDWLIDMHEGYDYSTNKANSSVGQTLIYYPSTTTATMAKGIVNTLNKGISSSYREFHLLRYPTAGSLSRASGQFLKAHTFIFETCSKQTLSTRVNQQLKAARYLLNDLNMI
jgi:succinylglutamate desuccinylase